MKYQPKQTAFLEEMEAVGDFNLLFDYLPGVSFFAKNSQFELVFANHSFLERVGLQDEGDIIGKKDFDLSPSPWRTIFARTMPGF